MDQKDKIDDTNSIKTEPIKISECKPKFELPTISDKNLAIVMLTIISVVSVYKLGVDGVPIVTGVVGAVGGFVMGTRSQK